MTIETTELHLDEVDWPLVLCGPIVRRVTRTSACVFLAAQEPFDGSLVVYDSTGPDRQALPQSGASRHSVALGAKLHVCVLEATGMELEPGRIYGYDLDLDFTPSGSRDLATLELLDGPLPLGYVVGELPSFVLPGALDRLKIAHGSCRKAHGCDHAALSDPDVLPLIDRLIESNRTDPYGRIQQLLLAGDQIYSDDVPAALLAALTSAGRLLMQWGQPEVFPDRRNQEVFTDDHVRLDPGDRSAFLDDQGVKNRPADADPQAWSDYAANHLLFFSEWCAMYVFAWSPALWQLRDLFDPDDRAAHPTRSYHYLADATAAWSASPDTTPPTLIYAQGLHHVRRALANVATYMVFDDHDVTDDWFLNGKVDDQLRGHGEVPTPGGRRLMRNGLASYAVFQHWGNAPEHFAAGTPGGRLLELLDASSGTPIIGQQGHDADADTILDVGPNSIGAARRDERMRWDYELVFDEHRLIVLDARTWRGFPNAPRAVSTAELLQAASERVDELSEWGSETLRRMGLAWADAADRAAGEVEPFLRAAALVMEITAILADDIANRVPTWRATALTLVDALVDYFDLLGLSTIFGAETVAVVGIEAAAQAARDADLPVTNDAVEGAMAVSIALSEMAFRIEQATMVWLGEVGVTSITGTAIVAQRTLASVTQLCAHLASYLQGTAVSYARAARFGAAAAREWLTVVSEHAAVLFGELTEETAEALADASKLTAPDLGELEDVAVVVGLIVDPVWSLLIGDGTKKVNAELLSAEAVGFQVTDRVADQSNFRELTFVVSPGPVIGHWLAEFAQRAQVLKTELTAGSGDETWDNEPWSGNMPAFTRFLDALCDLGSVVFLSGDVHYAFSSVTDYVSRAGKTARFVQFTSSATKNADSTTKSFALLDETTDDLASIAMAEFDFVELLPTAEEWAQLPELIAATVPPKEETNAEIQRYQLAVEEAVGDQVAAADKWWNSSLDLGAIRDGLQRQVDDVWDQTQVSWSQTKESVAKSVTELWDDPVKALVGDRLHSLPLAQEQSLLLLSSLGIDAEQLPEIHTTVLRDPRNEERASDSPGLAARLDTLFAMTRNVKVRLDRTTVGHTNMGIVTSQRTPIGRYVTHDLHWFPFDTSVDGRQVDPSKGESWRDDWIITRHVAALTRSAPADGHAIGTPAPGDVIVGDLDIDITSPTQSQSGPVRVHQIDPAGPTMPSLTVSVRTPGLTGVDDRALTRRVRLECHYEEGNRNDLVHVPGPNATSWITLPPGQTEWQPTFTEPCGGDLRVFAEVEVEGSTDTGSTADGAHVVWGVNPTKQEIRDTAVDRLSIHVVFHRESRFNQFAASPADIGRTVVGPQTVLRAADDGYGIGQLTIPRPRSRELWDWQANATDSIARLDGFRADAMLYVQQVRDGSSWTAATGVRPPSPPNEGQAFPDAPDFTEDQLDLEMWARYNSGRRYHDYNPATGQWQRQTSASTGLTVYAPELLAMRQQVAAGNLPRGW